MSLVECNGVALAEAQEGGDYIMEGKLLVMDDFSVFLSLY